MQASLSQTLEALYQRAYDLVDKGLFSEAKPILEECLRLGSDPALDVPIRQELARVRHELGDLQGALELRWDVKRLAPDRHANLWKLAQLLDELGHLQEAVTEAREAVRIVSNNRNYQATLTLIERKLKNSAVPASHSLRDFRVYANSEFHFEVSVPNNWQIDIRQEGEIAGGWVSRFLSRLSTLSGGTDVFTATAPRDEGFARMGILVRQIDRYAERRRQMEFSAETQVSVAGIPAIQVEYVFRGTRFRKIAVQRGGREYVIQFGTDGTFNTIIDRIIRSLRFP